MKNLEKTVIAISRWFNHIAGLCIVITMMLVVSNVLLRTLFKRPILGTTEYIGFLTALVISFSLAYCAVLNGHIAVSFIVDKLKPKVQTIIAIITNIAVVCFLGLSSWHIIKYGNRIFASGEVSPTTQTPYYLFVYLVSLGLLVFCLVVLVQLVNSFGKVVKK